MEQQKIQSQKKQAKDYYIDIADKVIGRVASLSKGDMVLLRRTQGLTSSELKPREKLVFYSLFPCGDGDQPIPRDPYLMDCILFGVQTACLQDGIINSDLKIENVIAKEYRAAERDYSGNGKSSKAAKIESFMASDGRGNKLFFHDLGWLALRFAKTSPINIFSLTHDLIGWGKVKSVKERWLQAMIGKDDTDAE